MTRGCSPDAVPAALPAFDKLRPNPHWAELPLFDRKGWRTMAFGEFAESVNERVEPADAWVDDSVVAASNFVAIGASGYYGAQRPLTNSGAHTVNSSQPVGVQVYGFGACDAYGYFGGIVK